MSTATTRHRAALKSPSTSETSTAPAGDVRIAIRDVSWDLYDRLSDEIGAGQNIHVAYEGTDIEIMTLGPLYEDIKDLLSLIVNLVFLEVGINYQGLGQTTWKRPELKRAQEADLCYYVDPVKIHTQADARARRTNDVADYPNPDLAIEIDLTPSKIDRPGIYAALNVPEIWRFEDAMVSIEQLAADGSYLPAQASRFLFVRPDEVVRWVLEEALRDRGDWSRRLREWASTELLPRARPDA